MILLQVQLGFVTPADEARLTQRFGRFFSATETRVEYPVTCDSHAEDVYRDEFADVADMRGQVDAASIIELPYDVEAFTPFSEESAGTVLYELTPA